MLSFFSKKKHSPDTPPEEAIPGPHENNGGDDFIFIEKKNDQPQPLAAGGPMYPPMPPAPFNLPYPGAAPYQAGTGGASNTGALGTPAPYIQGVPFEFAEHLSVKNSYDTVQMQVDGILALLTRQMSVDELEDGYNFTLERSLQNTESEAS